MELMFWENLNKYTANINLKQLPSVKTSILFEKIILTNIYSSLNMFLKKEQIGFSEFPSEDLDFFIWKKCWN